MGRTPQVALLIVLLSAATARAAEHPVPLPKDITADKCIACHEDKTKTKVVHPAVSMGCLTCHFVRTDGNSTRITLKHTKIPTLCGECHADKKPAALKGHFHPPAATDCMQCHDPHVSANEKLLKKATAGDKNENLCLACHEQGLKPAAKGSRHAALDSGCATCHITHKVGERAKRDDLKPEFRYHLTKSAPALCLTCHSADDKKLQDAHRNQPFATADCTSCHDPHQSAAPHLMQANLHAPFASGSCETCHAPSAAGKTKLTQPDARSLCLTCHEPAIKKIDAAKFAHAGTQGDCTACHDPHASRFARLVKSPVAACVACHATEADAYATKKTLHDPAFNQDCSICHAPHGNDRQHLLRANLDDLCLACHAPDAKALRSQDSRSEAILANTVRVPLGYVAKSPHIELSSARTGHPVPLHPLAGVDLRDTTQKLTCISCHNPHAGERRYMLTAADGSVRANCASCHKQQKEQGE